MIGGLVAAVVLLPLFVLIEHRGRRRCSTSRSSATGSSRPPPGPRSSTASRASPCCSSSSSTSRAPRGTTRSPPGSSSRRWRSGCWSPRRSPGSGPTATARGRWPPPGCWSAPLGLALMTTLQADRPYWQSTPLAAAWSGSARGCSTRPNTAAMMGTVPAERRGIAAGARTMLQNTGAVISIAFVLAIVTAAVPKPVLFKIFSGARLRPLAAPSSTPSSTTCTRRSGCWPRPRWSAPASRCCARATTAVPSRRAGRGERAQAVAEESRLTP